MSPARAVTALALTGLALTTSSCMGDGEGASETGGPAREIAVAFGGDILIHDEIFAQAHQQADKRSYDFRPLFRHVRPLVRHADLAFCHAEVPITTLGPPSGYPVFNAPPALASAIGWTGWDACSTASNHSLDQGQAGIAATNRALDRAGVGHTGMYESGRDRRTPLIVESKGIKLALLSYTTNTNLRALPHPFSVNLARQAAVVAVDARRARQAGADAVIVNVHWTLRPLLQAQLKAFPRGSDIAPEYVHTVSQAQRKYVRALLREEAITAVVGQGPHVVQPIRKIAGKYAIFSEGNLIAAQGAEYGFSASSRDGLIAMLNLRVAGGQARVTGVRYVPIWVRPSDHRVLPVGAAVERGLADRDELVASYRRTVGVVGKGPSIHPVPAGVQGLGRTRNSR